MGPIVLVATEDADFSLFLTHLLAGGGFRAISIAVRVAELEARISSAKALIIDSTDIERALELCRGARMRKRTSAIPMIAFIRAQNARHYLKFVTAGVDECILRPLSPELILLGVKGIIARRDQRAPARHAKSQSEHSGAFLVDGSTRVLEGTHGRACLSPTEFRILQRMLASPGQVLSRRDLVEAAWPPGRFVDDRTVDVHVCKLRKALYVATGKKFVQTVRSNGFIANFSER